MMNKHIQITIFSMLIILYLGCAGKTKNTETLSQDVIDTAITVKDTIPEDTKEVVQDSTLSPAALIMIKACNNYLEVNPDSKKGAEVLLLKGSVYYNNKLYNESRDVYKQALNKYKEQPEAIQAVRMIAQSYYEEKNFEEAQNWYRTLKDMATGSGEDNKEAIEKIAESIFRMAEMYEKEERYSDAAIQYERVSLEFPNAVIADISLFNAGLSYEKQTDWSRAILIFQKLKQKYSESKLLPKAMFRTAKSYEKLNRWNEAAQSYLRLVANFPGHELVSTSLYNAGFAFENAELLPEAAATFEKLAISFPKADDAADVLFKAGEIYGKAKDWESVTRVNGIFSSRFGHDKDRIVQAQCMIGVALYMQGKQAQSISKLKMAVNTYESLNNASEVNKYYAAKAQFTLADIYHEMMNDIKLIQPKSVYKKRLSTKSSFLDKTITAYSTVIKFKISEWTTRSIFQMGQSYEDFALDIFKQQRPSNAGLESIIALELGIAKAVEEYFVNQALHYHEQNVKLGIKQKLENKYILSSRKKLTYLPFMSGDNYLELVKITEQAKNKKKLEGFALVADKLSTLQKIAPFQERAIELFLKTLEMGSIYKLEDEYYRSASSLITKTSYTVAKTYSDVVNIARSAPIPENFDAYEEFVYKTKLLTQIQGYEDNGMTNFLKALKISEAYSITDTFVTKTRESLAEILFNKGRSFDLICIAAFDYPPYPNGISEAEKEEYRARFEEVALTYQEEAFSIYQTILDYHEKGFVAGNFVNHAYARLYQNFPDEYGVQSEKEVDKIISSSPQWKCFPDSQENWQTLDFNDAGWDKVAKTPAPNIAITGFDKNLPKPMWNGPEKSNHLFFRRSFYLKDPPLSANLTVAGIDEYQLFVNNEELVLDSLSKVNWQKATSWDLAGKLRKGKNIIAAFVKNNLRMDYGFFPELSMRVMEHEFLPRFPGEKEPATKKDLSIDHYKFPEIKNFTIEVQEVKE